MNDLNFHSSNFPLNKKMYCSYGHLIESVDKKPQGISNVLSTFLELPEGLDNIENYNDSLRKNKYKYLGISESRYDAYVLYEQHSLILGANETKTLYFSLNLPIIKEENPSIIQNVVRYDKLEEGWNFKIVYQAFANNIYEDLPDFVKSELEENNIEIFDGILYSNEVPLKKR